MCSGEVQVMMIMTMMTINICGVVYIGSKLVHFIIMLAKYLMHEIEKTNFLNKTSED